MFNLESNSMPSQIESSFSAAPKTALSPSPFDQIMVVEEVSPQCEE